MVRTEEKENKESKTEQMLENSKVNVRLIIAASWISHFLLWTFGDMVALLQQLNPDPISNALLTYVAAPLAVTQTFMIMFSLIAVPKWARWVNICVIPIFIIFNLGYLSEGTQGWNFILGIAYLVINVLIFYYAWNWPKQKSSI